MKLEDFLLALLLVFCLSCLVQAQEKETSDLPNLAEKETLDSQILEIEEHPIATKLKSMDKRLKVKLESGETLTGDLIWIDQTFFSVSKSGSIYQVAYEDVLDVEKGRYSFRERLRRRARGAGKVALKAGETSLYVGVTVAVISSPQITIPAIVGISHIGWGGW
jgi:small nuclear ribonucleoprotein (snRNP)-like protein